jgi:hypothetical protein
MTNLLEILNYSHYVLLAGFALIIIALLEPSKILIKQLLELNLPTLGAKRSIILGLIGCVLIIIGLGGVVALCEIPNLPPAIYTVERIPENPVTVSSNGTLIKIRIEVVDENDPNINQAANNSIQKMVYTPTQFVYNFSVKHPGESSYELIELQETKERSCNCTWWVFPQHAGVNQILINVALKGKNAESTNRFLEYLVRAT